MEEKKWTPRASIKLEPEYIDMTYETTLLAYEGTAGQMVMCIGRKKSIEMIQKNVTVAGCIVKEMKDYKLIHNSNGTMSVKLDTFRSRNFEFYADELREYSIQYLKNHIEIKKLRLVQRPQWCLTSRSR
jgi:hypothetical protein